MKQQPRSTISMSKISLIIILLAIVAASSIFAVMMLMKPEEKEGEEMPEEKPVSFPVNYSDYIRKSEEFKETNHSLAFLTAKWNQWYFFIWFSSGSVWDEETIKQLREAGINGGSTAAGWQPWARYFGKLEFPYYMDQTAGRGPLHKDWGKYDRGKPGGPLLESPFPLGSKETIDTCKNRISYNIGVAKGDPNLICYSLDDEPSATVFTRPAKWDTHPETMKKYYSWLKFYYFGSIENLNREWGTNYIKFEEVRIFTPDDLQDEYKKPLSEWNLAPWQDYLTFTDSLFANVIGELIEYANQLDPTRCVGFSGGQAPAAWGGYDYVKLMKKLQYIEAYNIGCSMEVIRSFNPLQAIPQVQTYFTTNSTVGKWFLYHNFAHGNRGVIAWAPVEDWFTYTSDGKRELKPWVSVIGKANMELVNQSKKLLLAKWIHDGIAIYYSQPSIQTTWFMDSYVHGLTWINRPPDYRLGSADGCRWAWTTMLEDMGLQYNFLGYDVVATEGVPDEYKILILTKAHSMSDVEIENIKKFVERGGVLIADYLPAVFDEHGKGRKRGGFDDLFGVSHANITKEDLFDGTCFSEVNAESDISGSFITASREVRARCERFQGKYVIAVKTIEPLRIVNYGKGKAILLNISPLEYLELRGTPEGDEYRKLFEDLIYPVVKPWVNVTDSSGKRLPITEVTYFRRGGRIYIIVTKNPLRGIAGVPDVASEKSLTDEPITVTITIDRPVKDLVNERTGERYGDVSSVQVEWVPSEIIFLSFAETQSSTLK
ncbi:hypothetical protein J7L29_04225 [Candidatus Bathyarchaeota archaeon]|nr:hypothetical protein [Candidatus Bathyarchaeota archaeon]